MPYRCKQQDNVWQLQVHKDGKWSKVANHKSQKACKAQIKAISASKHGVQNEMPIEIKGIIGRDFTEEKADSLLAEVKGTDTLDVSINSKGGSYLQAMKIYDRFTQHAGKKNIRISPYAASAGAVLALDPEAKVSIPANGLLFHHSPEIAQDEAKNPTQLRKMADDLDIVNATLVTMIIAKTNKSEAEVTTMLEAGTWFTAQQAKEYGLVDEILPLNRQRMDISNLTLPDQIVAQVDSFNKEIATMNLKDLCGKLGVEITDEMTDEQLEEAIVNHNTKLLEAGKKEEPKPKDKPSFSEGIINMIVKNRDMDIDNLVNEGRITPAVADDLKKQFSKKDEIVNCVDIEGNSIDNFEAVIAALAKNEKVLNFGGKTKATLVKGGDEGEPNPLIADAMARAKAAKEKR